MDPGIASWASGVHGQLAQKVAELENLRELVKCWHMRDAVAIPVLLYRKISGVVLPATVLMHILIGRVKIWFQSGKNIQTIKYSETLSKYNFSKSQFFLGMANGSRIAMSCHSCCMVNLFKSSSVQAKKKICLFKFLIFFFHYGSLIPEISAYNVRINRGFITLFPYLNIILIKYFPFAWFGKRRKIRSLVAYLTFIYIYAVSVVFYDVWWICLLYDSLPI